jgi:nitrogen regulatory protein P-II 2
LGYRVTANCAVTLKIGHSLILARRLHIALHNQKRGFCMKYIVAVIKPHKLDPVREALTALGVSGMTVSEVKGFGRQKGQTEIYRGAEYATNMVPKIKIEVACGSDEAPAVIEAIQAAAETGAIGDGKIFEFELAGALRIRTGDTNETAL